MQLLELTLETPAENIALDEALLNEAERAHPESELLRLWEPRAPMVVVGRSSRVADEVDVAQCHAHGVPIVRRPSGGAAILTGPGCMMWAVILNVMRRPALRAVDETHRFVLETVAQQLGTICPGVGRRGTSDLALGESKFSGNSLRCRRRHVLYHGTLLYDFSVDEIARYLKTPPRQPDYRRGRGHREFLINLPAAAGQLRAALVAAWRAKELRQCWPQDDVARLVAEKYGRDEWNLRT